ncbi:MAG: hypothetical protein CVV56_01245 [Tenericutes bacterium HGW-Tenericutes-1]|jgi:hypothetical protein|nr:MAG: hypothetical protein CVV56_01245 [Tenericutes bacterium HGW-Tenericutes-1]
MKQYYACTDGKDYIIQLDDDAKFVSITNIENRIKVNYPFQNHTEALSQYKTWIANADIRLPKTFFIETSPVTPIQALREELAKHDLTLPGIEKLRKFIVFHGYQSMIIDGDFDNKIIPEMNLVALRRISRNKKKFSIIPELQINTGLFAR